MKNILPFNFLIPFATSNTEGKTFRNLLALFVMVVGMNGVMGQVTIASQDFESTPATPTLTYSTTDIGSPGSSSGTSSGVTGAAGSNAPNGVNMYVGGSQGYRLQGPSSGSVNTGRIFTFSSVNTTSYSSIQASFRVAGMSLGSNSNGMDFTTGTTILGSSTPVDFALIEVSPDDGTTWYQQGVVSVAASNTNVRWSFGATGSGSKAYAANNTYSTFSTTGTGTITSGTTAITTATITGLPSVSNLRIRITLECNSANESWIIDDVIITGTATATPSIAISNGTIAAGSPNNGQTNVVLQRYDMAVTTADATLTGLTVTTAGTYAAADLTNLKCWYQTSNTFNSGTATLLSTKSTSLSSGSQVFPTFSSQSLVSGSTYYIFITADIASGATNGNTINIASTAFSNITFSSGTKTGTDPVAAAGVQTITVATPNIALTSPAASSANITVGTTNNVIYRFDLAITTATPSLTGVTINTSTGINSSSDLTNLKCWYQTSTTFNSGTATLLSTKTTSLAAGSQVFPSFSSQSLNTGSTYYIFITADVPLTATPNNTIIVSAITTSDLTFATGNKTGTANASGTKTIIDCTPVDVTSAAASSASVSSVLTWVNPTCYDEILIVAALASNSGTPTGNGSAYTSNLAYGSGTALGNGFVVYKGSTSSQTVTGLTNGTQYFFKYFTRRGTTWSSGTEVSATPNILGYYWNGASIAANPAAGGTGTWGTSNSWRQPTSSGAQATWADGNNAIFAGTAGTVTLDASKSATAYYFNTSGYNLVTTSATSVVLTGPINLGNNIGLTFSPNVNTTTPASGTVSVGSILGSGTANITISSAQGTATNIAQRLNIATASSSISVPINIVSAGGSGTGTVAGIVGTAVGTSLSSAATITNNTAVKTMIGATNGNDITVNGVISGSADLIFAAGASGGAGTITLNAANSYTGATIFNAANSGVIKLGVNDALPTGTNVTFGYASGNGGSLDLNGKNQTVASIINGGFGSSANRIVNNGATDATLTINGSTSPTAFVFGIQDGTTNKISLVKAGTGTLILDGTTTTGGNTYTGLTTVSGGTLRLNKSGGTTIPITNNVTVDGGTLQVSTNQTLNNLNLTSGTVIIDAGVTLTINDTITRTSGVIQGTATSNLVITGASGTIAFDQTTPGTTNVLKNLTISGSGTTTLGNALNITAGSSSGVVTVGTGATLTTGGFLTFKSDANGTASFGNSAGTISGNVTVERFIPLGKRAFRFLSPAVTTANFISGNWQQQTHITGGLGTTGLGFDATGTNNPSMYTYNNQVASGTGWTAIANTNATNLTAGVGYRVLIRGNTNVDLALPSATNMNAAITLSATGTLKTGTVALSSSSTPAINNTANTTTADFSLVGNPYQSAVDWHAVTKSGIAATYYAWDPNMGTGAARGNYVAYNVSTGTNNVGSQVGQFIQPGQAFFVKNTVAGTAGTLTFQEAHKATTSANVFRTANQTESANPASLSMQLYDPNELAIGGYPIDATKAVFGSEYTNELGLGDATKLEAPGENIAWFRNNTKLAIDAAAPVTITDELVMKTLRLGANKDYTFKIQTTNFDSALTPYLVDTFLNTQTEITTSQAFLASFVTTSNVASYSENRFKIVFQNAVLSTDTFASQVGLYPNPSKGNGFYLQLPSTAQATVKLYNTLGQEIAITNNSGYYQAKQSLASGVYHIMVTQDEKTSKLKWIVE